MRLLKFDTVHPKPYLHQKKEAIRKQVEKLSFEEYLDWLVRLRSNYSDFFTHNLKRYGWEAEEFITNDFDFIKKAIGHINPSAALCDLQENEGLKTRFIRHYIRSYKPDVIIAREQTGIVSSFWNQFRDNCLILGVMSCPMPRPWYVGDYDVLITSTPIFRDFFQASGTPSYLVGNGFDARILSELRLEGPVHDVVFVGGLGSPLFTRRTQLMEFLSRNIAFKWWGYGIEAINDSDRLKHTWQGQASGLDMFNILKQARIVINDYGREANGLGVNQRLFEVMGVGSFMLTRHSPNLADDFPPQVFATFHNEKDCLDKIKYYLKNDSEREQIAKAGQQYVLDNHSYQKVMGQIHEIILKECKRKFNGRKKNVVHRQTRLKRQEQKRRRLGPLENKGLQTTPHTNRRSGAYTPECVAAVSSANTPKLAVDSSCLHGENSAKSPYLVSAIVSTYNAERFVRGCLEDLEAQTIAGRLEIIVVNSGSEQNEEEIVSEFQKYYNNIRYIRTAKRETVYSAWNLAIQAASGKYITSANTDDRHRRDAFEVMANVLENRPDIALVYADLIVTATENETFENCTAIRLFRWLDWNRQDLLEKGCFIGPQPMWRKSVHERYGYFDTSFVTSGDFEFWLRISQTESFLHLPVLLGLYLKSPRSIEHTNRKQQIEENRKILAVYRKAHQKKEIIRKLDKVSSNLGVSAEKNRLPLNFGQTMDAKQTFIFEKNPPNCRQGGNKLKSFEQMYQEVRPLIENQWYEAAVSALKKIAEDYPDKAILFQELGALYYKLGKSEKALSSYRQAMQLQPENIEAQKNLADFYYAELGQAEEALKIYENILAIAPDDVQTLLLTGHINVSLNRFDTAKEKYRRVLKIESWNADARQYLEALENQGKGEAAFKSAEAMYRELAPALNSGQPEAAIEALEKLTEAYPGFALAHNDLGVLYYNRGDKARAQAHYERATELESNNMTFQKNLADFYFVECSRVQEAMDIYVKILETDPEDVETLLTAGHISVALQRFDDARDIYKRVLEVEPWNADARQFLEALDKPETNQTSGKSAAEMYQEIAPLMNNGQPDAAIYALEELLTTYPDFALAHNDLGVLYYRQGDKTAAQLHYEHAVRFGPDNITFQKNLADFYFVELNRVKEAMDIYVKILENHPEDVETLMTAGHISTALQRFEDARNIYRRVLEIEPWNADALQSLENLDNHRRNSSPAQPITNINPSLTADPNTSPTS